MKFPIALSIALVTTLPLVTAQDAAAPKPPKVKEVALRGAYADLAEPGFGLEGLLAGGQQTRSFFETLEQIEALAADEDTDTVLFDLSQGIGLNMAQVAEMERVLRKLRDAKRCIAYLENADNVQFALAAQCDEVLLADMGGIDIAAPAMSVMYLRDALDLLGVRMDILRCGDFKGAVEPYMLSEMSEHLERHYRTMLGTINDDIVRRIMAGRGLSRDKVRELQRRRLLTAEEALAAGLVDRVVPWNGARQAVRDLLANDALEFESGLQKKKKRNLNFMVLMQEMFQAEKEEEVEGATIAVMHLSGTIVDGIRAQPGSIVSGKTVETIRKLTDNDEVKGVVVRINSPGGSATASEAILLALGELAAKKPVVCSMGNLAASGGYYVTCFGAPILAEPATITGSIGVFGMKPNLGPMMRRIGINEHLVTIDDVGSLWSIDRAWTDEDRELMQGRIDGIYERFLGHVAKSRKMTREAVEAIAGGRVWSGAQAVEIGLVDEIGGLEMAIDKVAAAAQIDDYETLHLPRPANLMSLFANDLLDVRAQLGIDLSEVALARLRQMKGLFAVLGNALSQQPTQVWALMPGDITIR